MPLQSSALPSTYSVTVTPFKATVLGVPISTFISTCTALGLYILSTIILLITNCPFTKYVVYFFTYLCVAIFSVGLMATINMLYTRYRFNCLSLTVSLLYSGSAALIFVSLISMTFEGMCKPSGTPEGGIFTSKHVGNILVWCATAIGLCFQIVAHYFYG